MTTSSTAHSVRAEVHTQAADHVRDLHPGSDHALTVWAAGVLTLGHVLSLTADPRQLAAQVGTRGYRGDFDYDTDSKGVLLNRHSRGHVALIRYSEIAELIAPVVQQPWLTQRRAELATLRLELTGQRDAEFWRWITAKDHRTVVRDPELDRQWFDCEHRCYELAAEAWRACRPGEQTSLFDL
jgi:uncharacterized protein (DUF2249 family)